MATHDATERSVGERMELTGTRLTGRRSETKWAPLTTEFWAMVGRHRRNPDRRGRRGQFRCSAGVDDRRVRRCRLHCQ